MEAVGAAAGVLQLVQTVGLLANGVFGACRRLHNAPREINDLAIQVSWIRSHLQSCENTLTKISSNLLTPDIELSLTLALTDATSCLLELERIIARVEDASTIDLRVRWAAHTRARAGKILSRLEGSRTRMESAMQLLNL
jgi:hypothetical protein